MAGFMDRLAGRLGYVPRPQPGPTPASFAKRQYVAAQNQRLFASWPSQNSSIDYDLRAALKPLRGRSRHLAQNNDYAQRYLQMCKTHIVGPHGFALQSQAAFANGNLDAIANTAIERAFADWARRGVCEVTGKLSFVDVQQLLVETAARDGEYLVRKIEGADNPYGFALQVLDIDRLDVDRNEVLTGGNRVVMGVELTPAGRPVAYWLLSAHPSAVEWQTVNRWERVPAEQIYHGYRPQRPEQTRGVPWMHTAMARMQHLAGFEEAAVVAARVGASKMGWFTSQDGSADPMADTKDDNGVPYMNAEPGAFGVLPAGMSFTPFEPDYPNQTFDPFVRATLRGIASGLGVAYHTLANDLESVNFSSARAGTLEERDNWMAAQEWFANGFLYPLFGDWLRHALLHGMIRRADGSVLSADQVERYTRPVWQGRRWQWVDPLKDIEANIAAINAGLKSRRDVIAEQGRDIEDVWLQIAAEQRRAEELGIELGPDDADEPAAPQPAGEDGKETKNG
jgi:lambda family phage portal protein